jgi:catechol 2,3-dioxygenase-like lactoylglutathione lyase family enzyme
MGIRRLTHLGLCVSDLERSVRFYEQALGFRVVGTFSAGDPATATILEVEGVKAEMVYLERDGWRIELLHYPSPGHRGDGQRRPMNLLGLTHLSFAVDDLDSVAETAQRFGGSVLHSTRAKFQSGNSGLFLLDPDGLRIELIDRKGDPNRVPGSKSS